MAEEFKPTDFGGPIETIERVEVDDDADITGEQSKSIIIMRSLRECLRRRPFIIFDGAGWIWAVNADQTLCCPTKTFW
jgi:hypothetical protein